MRCAFIALTLVGSVALADDVPVDPVQVMEDECYTQWAIAADGLQANDATLVDPCGVWDPATSLDPNTGVCQFFCGDDDHMTVVGGGVQ